MVKWSQDWTGGGEVCISQNDFENNFPCNSNNPINQPAPQILPYQNIYAEPVNQNITKNAIKSDTQFLKEMLNFGEQTTTISGGGNNSDNIFPSINTNNSNISMDIKDIGNGNLLDYL